MVGRWGTLGLMASEILRLARAQSTFFAISKHVVIKLLVMKNINIHLKKTIFNTI